MRSIRKDWYVREEEKKEVFYHYYVCVLLNGKRTHA